MRSKNKFSLLNGVAGLTWGVGAGHTGSKMPDHHGRVGRFDHRWRNSAFGSSSLA